MIRKIVKYPSKVLEQVAEPIPEVTDRVRTLLDDMAETMYSADGVGLAAPQIGESVRAIIIDVNAGGLSEREALMKMVNPEIVSRDGEVEFDEGCLSVPDLRVTMKRSKKVRVRYMDEDGINQELNAEDLLAIAVQHEIDHLDGKLIIDNVSRLKRDMYLRKRRKAEEHPYAL